MKARSTDPKHKLDIAIFDESDRFVGLIAYERILRPYDPILFYIRNDKLLNDLKRRVVKVPNPFYGKGVEGLITFWKEDKEIWETEITEEEEIIILSLMIWRD